MRDPDYLLHPGGSDVYAVSDEWLIWRRRGTLRGVRFKNCSGVPHHNFIQEEAGAIRCCHGTSRRPYLLYFACRRMDIFGCISSIYAM